MMKALLAIAVFSIASAVFKPAQAHEMTLDDNGCHRDGIYGKYHCHGGNHAGESFVSVADYPDAVKHSRKLAENAPIRMNNSGVCVTPDSVLYNLQTKYFVYTSVKQCLRDGGHLDGTVVLRP